MNLLFWFQILNNLEYKFLMIFDGMWFLANNLCDFYPWALVGYCTKQNLSMICKLQVYQSCILYLCIFLTRLHQNVVDNTRWHLYAMNNYTLHLQHNYLPIGFTVKFVIVKPHRPLTWKLHVYILLWEVCTFNLS